MNNLFGHRFHDGEIVFYYDNLAMRRAYSWTACGNASLQGSCNSVTIGGNVYSVVWF